MLMFWFTAPLIRFRAKKLTQRQVANGIFSGSFLSATYFFLFELLPSPSTWPQFWPFWLNCAHFDMKDILPLQKLGFKCRSNPAPLNVSTYFVKKEKEWLIAKQSCLHVIDFFSFVRTFFTFATKCYCTCDLHYICEQLLHLCLQQGWTSI